jgi:hypothetical protein
MLHLHATLHIFQGRPKCPYRLHIHGCGSMWMCYQLMPRISREAVVLPEIEFFGLLSQPAICLNCVQVAHRVSQHISHVLLMCEKSTILREFLALTHSV